MINTLITKYNIKAYFIDIIFNKGKGFILKLYQPLPNK